MECKNASFIRFKMSHEPLTKISSMAEYYQINYLNADHALCYTHSRRIEYVLNSNWLKSLYFYYAIYISSVACFC